MSEENVTKSVNEAAQVGAKKPVGQSKKKAARRAAPKAPEAEAMLTLDPEKIDKLLKKMKEEAKAEAKAEIMKELGAQSSQASGVATPEAIARALAKQQKYSFNELNPIQPGFSYQLVKGKKLVMVFRRKDGTGRKQFLGDIHKHDDAKELYEKIKNTDKIEYR